MRKKRLGSGTAKKRKPVGAKPKSAKNVSPYTMPKKAKPAIHTLKSKVITPRTAPKKIGQVTKGREAFYAVDKKRKLK